MSVPRITQNRNDPSSLRNQPIPHSSNASDEVARRGRTEEESISFGEMARHGYGFGVGDPVREKARTNSWKKRKEGERRKERRGCEFVKVKEPERERKRKTVARVRTCKPHRSDVLLARSCG